MSSYSRMCSYERFYIYYIKEFRENAEKNIRMKDNEANTLCSSVSPRRYLTGWIEGFGLPEDPTIPLLPLCCCTGCRICCTDCRICCTGCRIGCCGCRVRCEGCCGCGWWCGDVLFFRKDNRKYFSKSSLKNQKSECITLCYRHF